MTIARLYQRQLQSFIRFRVDFRAERLSTPFTWSAGPLELSRSEPFTRFQWIGLRTLSSVRAFGIRPLIHEPFFSLGDFETAGFDIETAHSLSAHPSSAAGHYIVAELISENAATVYDCAYHSMSGWHIHAEHTLSRRPERRMLGLGA
ncbi:MAG TPA: hypothetical protein VJ011_10045 [Steroidobacteraceae bacterium]|nr:hypothetical protein [Steroidobacteraceae bacterium]